MYKKFLCFLLCVIIFSNQLFATTLPDISADGAILIEPTTNTVIYAKNANETFYPASTTKILTSLAILQDLPSNLVITRTIETMNNVPSDSSQIGLKIGDQYTVLDGLYAVLMASDNYVCYDLALADKGSINQFANVMNRLAISSNALTSNFVNPHGYHDEDHYTTPYDLSQIARIAFSNSTLKRIAGTPEYLFKLQNSNESILLKHTAALLDKASPYYNPHVVAAKTGYHTPAKRTLVAQAVYDDIELIGVIMRTDAPNQFEDMNKLFEYGAQNFKLSTHDNGFDYLTNLTYSDWSEPYVTEALQKGWITNNTHNYTIPITKREFVSLLKSAIPVSYSSLLDGTIQYNGASIYKENLKTTRGETAKVIYDFLKQLELISLNPSRNIADIDSLSSSYIEAIQFCVDNNIMAINDKDQFGPNQALSYENALYIVSHINSIINRYVSYGFPL